jgi:hypothetical protein
LDSVIEDVNEVLMKKRKSLVELHKFPNSIPLYIIFLYTSFIIVNILSVSYVIFIALKNIIFFEYYSIKSSNLGPLPSGKESCNSSWYYSPWQGLSAINTAYLVLEDQFYYSPSSRPPTRSSGWSPPPYASKEDIKV